MPPRCSATSEAASRKRVTRSKRQESQEIPPQETPEPSTRKRRKSTATAAGKRSDEEKQTSLYEVLGVERTATVAEITKAFRKQALTVHPDKRHGNMGTGEEENEREQFQVLNEAYQVLKDPAKRQIYDELGTVNDEDLDVELFAKWFGSGRFSRRIEQSDLDEFYAKYYGSAEELEDMKQIVVKDGNLMNLFGLLVGARAADCERYVKRIQEELKVALSQKELAGFRRQAAAWKRRERREAQELEREQKGDATPDLAAQILARRAVASPAINPRGALAAALRAAEGVERKAGTKRKI